jgi:hypothetical protein
MTLQDNIKAMLNSFGVAVTVKTRSVTADDAIYGNETLTYSSGTAETASMTNNRQEVDQTKQGEIERQYWSGKFKGTTILTPTSHLLWSTKTYEIISGSYRKYYDIDRSTVVMVEADFQEVIT